MKTRPVEFYSRGTKIVGNVNLPDDYKEGTKLPCIVPCSGYTGIGAAYPMLLSRLFTRYGYACVTFDYRGWPLLKENLVTQLRRMNTMTSLRPISLPSNSPRYKRKMLDCSAGALLRLLF